MQIYAREKKKSNFCCSKICPLSTHIHTLTHAHYIWCERARDRTKQQRYACCQPHNKFETHTHTQKNTRKNTYFVSHLCDVVSAYVCMRYVCVSAPPRFCVCVCFFFCPRRDRAKSPPPNNTATTATTLLHRKHSPFRHKRDNMCARTHTNTHIKCGLV